MKEEILQIASDLREGFITSKEAKAQLLLLFDVSGQSEQLVCDSYYANNLSLQKECLNCGKLLTEH